MKKSLILSIALLTSMLGFGQNLQETPASYEYIQLPLQPLDATVKTFSSEVKTQYLSSSDQIRNQARQDYTNDSLNHPNIVAEAKVRHEEALVKYEEELALAKEAYEMEKETYENLSALEKIALDAKPPKPRFPSKPVYRDPSLPVYREPNLRDVIIYDPKVLASSHLTLYGYDRVEADGDIKISVDLHDFEWFEPTTIMKEQSYYNKTTQQTEKRQVRYYQIKYRHPATVTITKNGSILYNGVLEASNEFTELEVKDMPSRTNLEKASVISTLDKVGSFINSEYGFARITKSTKVGYVKNKKGEYDDLEEAKDFAVSGYQASVDDNDEAAKSDVEQAVKVWEKALNESDLEDRKARIDEKVTTMIHFNLLVAYMYLNNFDACQKTFDALDKLKLSYTEKQVVEDLKAQFDDIKKRHEINNK